MSFSNRPVLDRRHRPRWQEERRTQQIVVSAIALSIAVALGMFGATAWVDYYDRHLRQVAMVSDAVFDRDDLARRTRVIQVEIGVEAQRLQARTTDPALLEQQLGFLDQELAQAESTAVDSLVGGAVHRALAPDLGVVVTDPEVDAALAERATTPEEVRLSIIAVNAAPDDAEPGAAPSEADFERALADARAILGRLRSGEAFADLATAESDDASASRAGDIGFISADDEPNAVLFAVTQGVPVGSIVGPVRNDRGYTIARVEDRREAERDERYVETFERAGVSAADLRAYIADEIYDERFRAYFGERVAVPRQEQRRVAQILIAEQTGAPVAERRVRHVLIAPVDGTQDQTAATDEQWAAALARAEEVRRRLLAPDADWQTIAAEESADTGSAGRGGDLGWAPATGEGFVPEFAEVMSTLPIGELSEPVRSQFGYHLIEVIDERASAAEQVEEIVAQLEVEPDSFAEIARRSSEDPATAAEDGELGWVARYELDPAKEDAIWQLAAVGDVSDPVAVPGEGTYIFRLLELAAEREVEEDRLAEIRRVGYDRWLREQEAQLQVWIAPEFAAPAAPPPAGPS